MFKVMYSTKVGSDYTEEEAQKLKIKVPKLQNWWVQNFTNDDIVFKLNFTEPMYVSTMDESDIFSVEFKVPQLF